MAAVTDKNARIETILKTGGYKLTLSASGARQARDRLGPPRVKRKATVIASTIVTYAKAMKMTVKIALSKAGKNLRLIERTAHSADAPPRVLADSKWAQRLTDDDRRALSPLFWTHINPYGTFDLDMNTHLDLAAVGSALATRQARAGS